MFGDDVLISWDTLIMDSDHYRIYKLENPAEQINYTRTISIGNHVWIGCNAIILKGSVISDNSILAAGSVTSGKFTKENYIIAGNKYLKESIN